MTTRRIRSATKGVRLAFLVTVGWLGLPPAPLTAQTVTTYTYDAAGRLTGARASGQGYRYTYDAAGNILSAVAGTPAIITSLAPSDVLAGSGTFALQVDGENFAVGSVVRWNGTARPTVFVSATRVTATIDAADVASPNMASVTLLNPGAAGASNAVPLFVNASGAAVGPGDVQMTLDTASGQVQLTIWGVTGSGTVSARGVAPSADPQPPGLVFLASRNFIVHASGIGFSRAVLCFPYGDTDVAAAGLTEDRLVLLHQAHGSTVWDDVTTSRDPASNVICGQVSSFSPFAIAGVSAAASPYARYFAEGATSTFFNAQVALVNPDLVADANVTLRFMKSDGTQSYRYVRVPSHGRRTVNAKLVPEMATAEFSTVVSSDLPVVADRTMTWNATGYGSHAETSVLAPATTWYLAEGATHSNFNLFYLIQNPADTAAAVEVTYLRPAPAAPFVTSYTVAPRSRFTIWVNTAAAELASTDVSATLRSTNDVPIIVERAMYLDATGQVFGAGHDSAGVTAPATRWFLAEGATGAYFDLFILIQNPTDRDATVTAAYLLPDGTTVEKAYTVAGNSRYNIWVDQEGAALANTPVSTTLTSTNDVPIVVERAMWWPGPTSATWLEAHNSPGATVTGTLWALAEGEQGGANATETYVLIANASSFAGQATVTVLFEDGATAEKTIALPPSSRTNVNMPADFPAQFPAGANRRFGLLIESVGATPAEIVVERATYANASGVTWAAGTNALGTRLR